MGAWADLKREVTLQCFWHSLDVLKPGSDAGLALLGIAFCQAADRSPSS